MVDSMDNMLTNLKETLMHPTSKIIMCHIVGLDLLSYNLTRKEHDELLIADYPFMQMVINES